jgi:hypothetical protein
MNIQEIYDQALVDPTLFSNIDIDQLLENIESETTEYLEGQTLKTISETIYRILIPLQSQLNIIAICDKLIGYRYVERICEIRIGVYIRWINNTDIDSNNSNKAITNKTLLLKPGGTVISVKVCEECVQIICKTAFHRHISFRFDECIVFQKLTTEEQLILMSYEYIQNQESV